MTGGSTHDPPVYMFPDFFRSTQTRSSAAFDSFTAAISIFARLVAADTCVARLAATTTMARLVSSMVLLVLALFVSGEQPWAILQAVLTRYGGNTL